MWVGGGRLKSVVMRQSYDAAKIPRNSPRQEKNPEHQFDGGHLSFVIRFLCNYQLGREAVFIFIQELTYRHFVPRKQYC